MHYIRDMLTPRALALATDTRLVELLIDLEATERVWAEGVQLVIDDWGYPEEFAWSHAADLFDAAGKLAQHLGRYDYVDAHTEAIRRAKPANSGGR